MSVEFFTVIKVGITVSVKIFGLDILLEFFFINKNAKLQPS